MHRDRRPSPARTATLPRRRATIPSSASEWARSQLPSVSSIVLLHAADLHHRAVKALDGRRGSFIVCATGWVEPAGPYTAYQGATLMKTIASAACGLLLLWARAPPHTLGGSHTSGTG